MTRVGIECFATNAVVSTCKVARAPSPIGPGSVSACSTNRRKVNDRRELYRAVTQKDLPLAVIRESGPLFASRRDPRASVRKPR